MSLIIIHEIFGEFHKNYMTYYLGSGSFFFFASMSQHVHYTLIVTIQTKITHFQVLVNTARMILSEACRW